MLKRVTLFFSIMKLNHDVNRKKLKTSSQF